MHKIEAIFIQTMVQNSKVGSLCFQILKDSLQYKKTLIKQTLIAIIHLQLKNDKRKTFTAQCSKMSTEIKPKQRKG